MHKPHFAITHTNKRACSSVWLEHCSYMSLIRKNYILLEKILREAGVLGSNPSRLIKKRTMSKTKKHSLKEIEEKILKIAIELAKSGHGALFVIGKNIKYERLIKQKFKKINIFEKGAEKILKGLAVIDGAIIIDPKGNMVEYGVLIKKTSPFTGFGTRHAAAITSSKNGNLTILISEEERKVKIFREGRYLMQIDPFQKNIEKNIPLVPKILESTGAGVIGTIGTVALAPTLGIALIPGIILFGGSYFAIKSFLEKNKR